MKSYFIRSKTINGLFLCIFLMMTAYLSAAEGAGNSDPETDLSNIHRTSSDESESTRFVSIDFNNVDINVLIKFISELTGKNFIVDQRVKGKVTIISPSKISIEEAYRVFESVLEVHGFAAVRAGEVIKILSLPDARTKNIETKIREEAGSPEDKIVTQLIPLKYADADEIKRLFAPLVSKSSVILSYPPTNTLVITDVSSNIDRLVRILNIIDITGVGQELSIIPLEFADATKLVKILESAFQTTQKSAKGDTLNQVKFIADERTNTIVVTASEDDTVRIKKLITLLDKETPRGKGKIRVYYLEYATAEELAKVLQELPKSQSSPSEGKATAPVVSEKVKITADKATNSLIIMADTDDYLVIEEIIKNLDIPRAMVFIEALIMEVTVNKELELGTEWQVGGKTTVDNKNALVEGTYINEGVLSPPVSSVPSPGGFSFGIFSENITIGGISFSNISAIARAFKNDSDFHILSTPQILTTDNEEARITVGDNIPFQTRSTVDESNNTFNSYEYRDVGKILKITPHISKDRLVRLAISLEVTSVTSAVGDLQPTTSKRTVDTTVIVQDNHTVVIGGLIDDIIDNSENKVPCLGEVPILGWLFKSMNSKDNKTNLYVFITPRVIKSPEEADEVYRKKKDEIDNVTGGGTGKDSIKLYKKTPKDAPSDSEPSAPAS
ncbi:MAG TPA: type II secretion system secretin GspD [Desulfobacterales bacterium]|nr:type II secretion system secretin GspD [Desulfobacterales bacterium]